MPWYVPPGAEGISTPALLVYPERIEENVQRMLRMVGNDPLRLWPHVKTSKCRHIIERMVAHGIRRFKGATLPELEIALQAGATDLLLALRQDGESSSPLLDMPAVCRRLLAPLLLVFLNHIRLFRIHFDGFYSSLVNFQAT